MTTNSIALKTKKALQLIVHQFTEVLGGERGAKIAVGRGVGA